jgi:hypothetical protein
MKSKYLLMVPVLALAFSQVSAKPSDEGKTNVPGATLSSQSLSLKVGEPFLAARSRILRSGWRPIGTYRDYEYIGTEKELIDRKFFEVAYCSMDAGSLCVLYYRKGTQCLTVGTVGEELKFMKVTRWSGECPVETRR